jgi:hypothetical protein
MSSVKYILGLSLGVLTELIDEAGAAIKAHTVPMIMVMASPLHKCACGYSWRLILHAFSPKEPFPAFASFFCFKTKLNVCFFFSSGPAGGAVRTRVSLSQLLQRARARRKRPGYSFPAIADDGVSYRALLHARTPSMTIAWLHPTPQACRRPSTNVPRCIDFCSLFSVPFLHFSLSRENERE